MPETMPAVVGRSPVVVGLDTSLTATGIASSEGWCRTVGWTDKKRLITRLPHIERAQALATVLAAIVQAVSTPDMVVMETPALSRAGGGAHERGWLWWETYRRLADAGVPVGLMSTGQRAIYATGKGTAGKSVVVDAVARRWPAWMTGGDDNQADAVTLMAAGRDWAGHPIAQVPKAHRRALDAAQWPQGVRA